MTSPPRLTVEVAGRPAPQGSKKMGEHGQLREASPYLAAWRAAVKRAVYARYLELGIDPAALPLYRGPVGCAVHFIMPDARRVDGPPDLDKLIRGTWDALSQARVWEDDGRVVSLTTTKVTQPEMEYPTGARIEVWAVHP